MCELCRTAGSWHWDQKELETQKETLLRYSFWVGKQFFKNEKKKTRTQAYKGHTLGSTKHWLSLQSTSLLFHMQY